MCQLYGSKKIANIDEVRYRIFKAKIKSTNCKNPLEFKSVDLMLLISYQKVLQLYIKRAWYISKLYRSTSDAYSCIDVEPIFHRWRSSSCRNFLANDWFHDDQVPQAIEDDAGDAAEGDACHILQEENTDSNNSDSDATD